MRTGRLFSCCLELLDDRWRSGNRYIENWEGVFDFWRSIGGVVFVPVDTIDGLVGDGWNTWGAPDEIACSSGVLMMISDARLISDGLRGVDVGLGGDVEGAGTTTGTSTAAPG